MKARFVFLIAFAMSAAPRVDAMDAKDLFLLPIPKEFAAEEGTLVLDSRLAASISSDRSKAPTELKITILVKEPAPVPLAEEPPADEEGYSIRVSPTGISVRGRTSRGLLHGRATLRQVLRASAGKDGKSVEVPCLRIRDWPSLRWRGFADDLTRGPSTTLEYLKDEAVLSADAKLNFLSYYMEHQFVFAKHPEIGPEGGSLTAGDLRSLVDYARGLGVEIVGNQQSFGHFYHILKHERYAGLREGRDVLRPAFPETYRLLDDLYSEIFPALDAKLFNVCCDETWELGRGPSKPLVEKEGLGRVYANHIVELHKLIAGKYGRRMMMWGDIILQHPEELPRLPRDIVMLTWGYDPRASFEDQIVPFAKSGFEFFVCPGVSCWGRLAPDFATAEVNIRNFVRDGLKHGAIGMLNTTWDDSGENLNGPNGPGILWGAECAWSGEKADLETFGRRAGFLLFGEREGILARHIAAVKALYALPGTGGMGDDVFWKVEPVRAVRSVASERAAVLKHLALAKEAEDSAEALVRSASRGKHEAECFLVLGRKLGHIARRRAALLDLADSGVEAGKKEAALAALRDECLAIKDAYGKAWLAECRPYHLPVVLARFDALAAAYADLAKEIREKGAARFVVAETGARAREAAADETLSTDAKGTEKLPLRTPIAVRANGKNRRDLPVEMAWRGGPLGAEPILRESRDAWIPVQRIVEGGKESIAFVLPGDLPADGERRLVLAHGGSEVPSRISSPHPVVSVAEAGGGFRVDNGPLRLLILPEGAHIYEWRAKDLEWRDLTFPGRDGWAGFLDTGNEGRSARYEIEVIARGPVVARLACRSAEGPEKTISVWAGMPWVEVFLDRGVGYFWNFDGVDLAGDGPTPGISIFSGGPKGDIGPAAGGAGSQRVKEGAIWSAKYRAGDRAIALLTPETPARHSVGPGGGWGGVGIEGSPPVLHFIVYGGRAPEDLPAVLDRLCDSLTLLPPPALRRGPTRED